MSSPLASSHPAVGRYCFGPLAALASNVAANGTDAIPTRRIAIETHVDICRFPAPPAPSRLVLDEIGRA